MPSLAVVILVLALGAQLSPTSYDIFMQLPREERTARFNELSPDDRATILKTQAERWLRRNRGQLTAAQSAILEDNIRFISPALFRQPLDQGVARRAKELEARTSSVLSPAQAAAALSVQGDYIPR